MNQPKQSILLINRLLSIKDTSPFVLIYDSVAQSAHYLIQELFHRADKNVNVIYLSFETIRRPQRVDHFIDGNGNDYNLLVSKVSAKVQSEKKNLIIIDDIGYIENEQISQFISQLIAPTIQVFAIYHSFIHDPITPQNLYYPSTSSLLSYFATDIITVTPFETGTNDSEERDLQISNLTIPLDCNLPKFEIKLTHRRKSGRAITSFFIINNATHSLSVIDKQELATAGETTGDSDALLKGLTTFQIGLTDRQKQVRDGVDLPFLEAQEFNTGGAIVYEFEKDDDYDEEDPYEDPF